jgi:hypothetical protein
MFRIHDILVWIRILGTMPLTNGSGSGSCYFLTKTNLKKRFFCLLLFEGIFTSFFKDKKVQKKSQKIRNQGFSCNFCLMIEGPRSGGGSGSIPLNIGSGSGRPKNMWIRWIRIWHTAYNTLHLVIYTFIDPSSFAVLTKCIEEEAR